MSTLHTLLVISVILGVLQAHVLTKEELKGTIKQFRRFFWGNGGCKYSYYECCDDGVTEAQGPNKEGCPPPTQEQLDEKVMRERFSAIDENGDKTITYEELWLVMTNMDDSDLRKTSDMWYQLDIDKNERVDFNEFNKVVTEKKMKTDEELRKELGLDDKQFKDYMTTFRYVDQNRDDEISPEELATVFEAHSESRNKVDIRMERIDADQSGTIDFKEFVKEFNELGYFRVVRSTFFFHDHNSDGYIDEHERFPFFEDANTNGDNIVSYEEYRRWKLAQLDW